MEGDESSMIGSKFLPTIPGNLNSLIGKSIVIDSDDPRDVIELLGETLGITDHKSNTVSFWFLDVLALQTLRHRTDLDDESRSFLISWLSGEILLIRDKKLIRERFFRLMDNVFLAVADRISAGGCLLYWDEFITPNIGDWVQTDIEENLWDPEEYSSKESLEQKVSRQSQNLKVDPVQVPLPSRCEIKSSNDPAIRESLRVLDIIIDATYDMYANQMRYALIYAVFVEQIELQTYYINVPEVIVVPDDPQPHKALSHRTASKDSQPIGKRAVKKRKGKKKTKT